MIASLDDFPPKTARLLEEELNRRYFTPVIEKVLSVKEEFGYIYWDVLSTAGPVRFTVKSSENNIVSLTNDKLLIIDVDGNRFELPDYQNTNAQHLKIIETLL